MEEEPDVILASGSPRRLALLREAGYRPRVVVSGIEERVLPEETPADYVRRMAREKAWAVRRREGGGVPVLGADTVVVCDGAVLEKPVDAAEARAMLRRLSGRGHEVLTGVCILAEEERVFVESTTVRFRGLGDEEIGRYVAGGEPMDKAGAYAIQGGASAMVEACEGSYTNVVGLPMERVSAVLGGADQRPTERR